MQDKEVPVVAVCMAVHNGMQWLPEQMKCILAQEGVEVRVFVSVDQSFDGSEDWINQQASEDHRIKVLPHGLVFGGAAANFFRLLQNVDFSTTDFVSLADQDDIWYSHKLKRACQQLQALDADGYSSNVIAFWPDGTKKGIQKSQPQRPWDFLFEAAGPGCTYVLRQPLALALQVFLQSQGNRLQTIGLHDWLIYAFARSHGWRWHIDSQPGMQYRQHNSNQVGVNQGWRALQMRAEKVLNGWAFEQAAAIARCNGLQDQAFVAQWLAGETRGLLHLAWHCGQCRRRPRDQLYFAFSCALMVIRQIYYRLGQHPK